VLTPVARPGGACGPANLPAVRRAGAPARVPSPPERHETVETRRQTDELLQALATSLADVFIFVVNNMALADQVYLSTLRESRGSKPLIVVHNFMNIERPDEMEQTWMV